MSSESVQTQISLQVCAKLYIWAKFRKRSQKPSFMFLGALHLNVIQGTLCFRSYWAFMNNDALILHLAALIYWFSSQ